MTHVVVNVWVVQSESQRDNFNECAREDSHLNAGSYNCTEHGTVSALAIIPLGTEPIRHNALPCVS
jgi:hypothetical protein